VTRRPGRLAEPGADAAAVLAEFIRLHPSLKDDLQGLLALQRRLDGARGSAAAPAPRRLGPFVIVGVLARGGMGEILEAMQEPLGRRVAVKVVRPALLSPEARAKFANKQRVLARLRQTHIVPIHAAGEEGAMQYFAMPLVEGATLHDIIRAARRRETAAPSGRTPTVAELAGRTAAAEAETGEAAPARPARLSMAYFRSAAEVVADAAEALQHVHDAGVVHRDVKPANIMVDRAGRPRVIDFGLAETIIPAEAAWEGRADGTPNYMAPENPAGRPHPLRHRRRRRRDRRGGRGRVACGRPEVTPRRGRQASQGATDRPMVGRGANRVKPGAACAAAARVPCGAHEERSDVETNAGLDRGGRVGGRLARAGYRAGQGCRAEGRCRPGRGVGPGPVLQRLHRRGEGFAAG